MEVTTIICDVCRTHKQEANHWYVAITDPRVASSRLFDGIAFGTIGSEVNDPLLKVEHICGQECLHKRLSQWLESL
jgi:hypothetical protein